MPIRKYYNQNWLPSIFNDFFDNDWMEKANATAPAINVIWKRKLKTKIKIKKTRNTCDVSSLTQNSNSHFTCLTMLIRKR